jgi:hypothetical protein
MGNNATNASIVVEAKLKLTVEKNILIRKGSLRLPCIWKIMASAGLLEL